MQSRLFEIRNEKQFKASLFHLPHRPTNEDHKKGPKKPPKETQKPSSGVSEDAPKRSPNLVPFKKCFAAGSTPGDLVFAGPGTWKGDPDYI